MAKYNYEAFQKWVPMFDEKLNQECVTKDLNGNPEMVRYGANVGELIVPMMQTDGLGNYDKYGADAYSHGSANMTHETIKCTFDRSRKFAVDAMDNNDADGTILLAVINDFMESNVIPETDAYRFSRMAQKKGVTTKISKIENAEQAVKELRAGQTALDKNAVKRNGRICYMTYELHGMLTDMDTTKSRAILNEFDKIVDVEPNRFYSAIDQLDGRSEGQEAGGYIPAKTKTEEVGTANASTKEFLVKAAPSYLDRVTVNSKAVTNYTYDPDSGKITFKEAPASGAVVAEFGTGVPLNFMIVYKPAVIQYQKHAPAKVVAPDDNKDADRWEFGYRDCGVSEVYQNKVKGIYVNKAN